MNIRSPHSRAINGVPVFQTRFAQRDCFSVFRAEHLPDSSAQKQRIREKLLDILLTLNVSQFERCIALLLHALEYEEVQIMRLPSVKRRSHKGRNAHGGFDLSARSSAFSLCLTLVQVKQYARPVSRRFVDELRGAMLRQGAQQGLLLTTSTFPGNAKVSAQENTMLPIRLINGKELAELLYRHRIGVRCKERISKSGERRLIWRLDRKFFRNLRRRTM